MFALEISFDDGASPAETLFMRRPQALIGASEYANVVVEDLKELDLQIRVVRDLGRRFRCKPLGQAAGGRDLSLLLEGVYEGEATLSVGGVSFFLTALDLDLGMRESEPPDRAGVRVLRHACASLSPKFPAVMVGGGVPMVISFVPDQPVYIGRSKQCGVRLDSPDISARHARMGYESGEFWIEDLGSTNGTFVGGQQVSGRAPLAPGVPAVLGRDIVIVGVTSEDQIEGAPRVLATRSAAAVEERRYPVLLSRSELVRPARLVIPFNSVVNLGRDPKSELWLGAPHVSRRHCALTMNPDGRIMVSDFSTNGTAHDAGLLSRGESMELRDTPKVFDFGGGITVALCFTEEEEEKFQQFGGAINTYRPAKTKPLEVDHLFQQAGPESNSDTKVRSRSRGPARELLSFFQSLPPVGKVFLLATLAAMGMVITVIVNLLLGLF